VGPFERLVKGILRVSNGLVQKKQGDENLRRRSNPATCRGRAQTFSNHQTDSSMSQRGEEIERIEVGHELSEQCRKDNLLVLAHTLTIQNLNDLHFVIKS
jgi:hypothetical protein